VPDKIEAMDEFMRKKHIFIIEMCYLIPLVALGAVFLSQP